MSLKLIIDVDTGVDDAHALLLALARDDVTRARNDVTILAVTCVNGNTTLDNVVRNTLRVLKVCKRLDIPIYRGSNRTLMGRPSPETHFHGMDGMGDSETDHVDLSIVKKLPASPAIVKIVNENPGEVTLFACGPLTNVALALREDENFGANLKDCCIMGGNTTGTGNFKICGEFNFACDPEAAKCVLEQLKSEITLVAMEPCLDHALPVEWFKEFSEIDTEIGRFNKRIIGMIQENWQARSMTKMAMYDAFAMALVLEPSCILEFEEHFCSVETGGEFCRGMMVIDRRKHLGRKPNVKLISKVNIDMVADMMVKSVKRIV